MAEDTSTPGPQESAAAPDGTTVLPLAAAPSWIAYVADPNGVTLAQLIAEVPPRDPLTVVVAIEDFFFAHEHWRAAQHAALLRVGAFPAFIAHVDLVKAFYFATAACRFSKDDPRAQLALAQVNWERRLPHAIFHDVEVIRAGEARLRKELDEPRVQRLLAEALVLEGMAHAYLRDVHRAQACFLEAERLGWLTVRAVLQLLLAAVPDFPDASMWAAVRLPPDVPLGGRASACHLWARRHTLIRALRLRSEQHDGR